MHHRKMRAYGEREHGGKYIIDDYAFSRNHTKAINIRRTKRLLKKKARQKSRRGLIKLKQNYSEECP